MTDQAISSTTGTGEGARRYNAVKALKRRFTRNDFIASGLFFLALLLVPALPTVKGWMLSQGSLIIIYVIAALGVLVHWSGSPGWSRSAMAGSWRSAPIHPRC